MRRFSIGLVAGFLAFASLLSLAHAQIAAESVYMPTPNGTPEPYGPSGLPVNAVQVAVTGTSTISNGTAAMPAVAGKTNYVCGFEYEASTTALFYGNTTLAGLLGGTLTFYTFLPAATTGSGTKKASFSPCFPASAVNTAITLTTPAIGSGGAAFFNIWGFVR